MLKLILTKVFILIFSVLAVVQANASSPRSDVCKLISVFVNKGGNSGVSKIAQMFSYSADTAKKAENSLGGLKEYKYLEGSAFLVVDLDKLYEQYFVVMNLAKHGNLFFAMEFGKLNDELRLSHFTYADRYMKVANEYGGFAQKPEKIGC